MPDRATSQVAVAWVVHRQAQRIALFYLAAALCNAAIYWVWDGQLHAGMHQTRTLMKQDPVGITYLVYGSEWLFAMLVRIFGAFSVALPLVAGGVFVRCRRRAWCSAVAAISCVALPAGSLVGVYALWFARSVCPRHRAGRRRS